MIEASRSAVALRALLRRDRRVRLRVRVAVARSTRGDNVAVANLFFLQGSAPRRVRRDFLALFLVCLGDRGGDRRRGSRSACSCRCSRSASPACGRRGHGDVPAPSARNASTARVIAYRAMADEAHEQIHVAADPLDCFDLATDFEAYPRWAKDVKEATILSATTPAGPRAWSTGPPRWAATCATSSTTTTANAPALVLVDARGGRHVACARRDATRSTPTATAPASPTTSASTSRSRCPGW